MCSMCDKHVLDAGVGQCHYARKFFIPIDAGAVYSCWHHDRHVRDVTLDYQILICRYAGLYTRIEPTGVFQGNTFNLGEHSRGDLAICNLGPRSILSDVRVTSVVPANGAHLSAIEMRNPELVNINLSRNYKSKMDKYGAAAKEANYEFLPMVVDIGGKLHPEFKKFLVDVLKLASESRNIRFSVLWNYWISALMVTLQKGRARSIIRLGTQVFGRQVRETFETSDQVVSRGSYRNQNF